MKHIVRQNLQANLELAQILLEFEADIVTVAKHFIDCFSQGGKLIFLGNGGSAADAQHIAGEYLGKLYHKRISLPALALPANVASFSAIANDWNYEYAFARQLESLALSDDIVVSLSTSGQSKNVVQAIKHCQQNKIKTISFTGERENEVAKLSVVCLQMPSIEIPRIQESYMLINHIICELVEDKFINKTLIN